MEYSDGATGRRSTARRGSQVESLRRRLGVEVTRGAAGDWTTAMHPNEVTTKSEDMNGSIGGTEGSGCTAERYGVNHVRRETIRRPLGRS